MGQEYGWTEWLAAVERHLLRMADLSRDELPDWTWRDAYDDGMTPRGAAAAALDDARD